MAWQARIHPEANVVEMVYSGWVPPSELHSAFKTALALSQKHRTLRFLTDCSLMEGGHTERDLYALLGSIDMTPYLDEFMEAVILPDRSKPEVAECVEFWELTTRTNGLNVVIWNDRVAALEWLKLGNPRVAAAMVPTRSAPVVQPSA